MKIKIKESIIKENDYSETDEFTLIKEMNHWIKQLKNFFVDDSKAQKAIADYFYHDDGKHQEDFRELQASVKALHKLWLKLDKITEDVEDKENMKESVYTDAGFNSRKDYLKSLADDYGVDYNIVAELAYMLGPDEDFDALVTEIEDLVDDYDDVDNPWELERYLRTANYVVYDDKSDESHFYIAPFDNFEDAGYAVARNITQYASSSWLYTTRNHTRTYYDADRLNTSNLIVGRFYVDEAEPNDYIDYDLYDNADDVIKNVRNILDMCETKTEKY